jgi:plasmid maintenance system antidote protein VapI
MESSQYRLAKEIGVPAQRIGDIGAGKRAITADTDLRLCRFFWSFKWRLAAGTSGL